MLSLLIIAALSFLASSAPAWAQAPRAERPTYTIGDKWILGAGVYDLIRFENDLYIYADDSGQEIHLSKDLTVARVKRGQGTHDFAPPPKLTWPLEVGKSGESMSFWQAPRIPRGLWITMAWKVEAYEDVTVPAGTFKAFRIVQSFSFPGPQGTQWRDITIWYAPEVRQVVKIASPEIYLLNLRVVAIDRPELTPLDLALREPKEQARVTSDGIVLIGKATSGKGVTQVAVTLNGAEVSKLEDKVAPKSEVELDLPIKLREGKNILIVTAVDAAGETRQQARTLFYEKPPPLPPEAPKSPPAPPAPPAVTKPPAPASPPAVAKPTPPSITPAPPAAPKPLPPALAASPVPEKPALPSAPTAASPVAPEPPKPAPPAVAKPASPPSVTSPPASTAPPVAIASLPPLQVTISSPGDQARVENESIGLAGLVSGGKGVNKVIVALNGIELSRLEERAPQRSMPVNLSVKLREGQNTIVVTATDADGTIQQEVRAVRYEKPAPLTVAFRYPEDKSRVTEEASVVAAVVTSSKGVAKVSVSLNGTEVHQQTERTPQNSVAVSVPVKLREGANAIVLSAAEPDGNVRQEIRTVIYERPKAAVAELKAPPPPAPTRDRWAVVIGAGRYESPEIPRLRYTVPDAEALYEVLIGPGGFKKEHVLLITDKTEKKPTLRNIKWSLGTFLARSAKKDDTVVIFFAGHGAPEVDQQGVERDGFAKYLVPSDAEPDDLYSSGLPMDELQTIFARIEAERVVVFLDACYSGAAGGRTFASKKTRSAHVDDLFLERLTQSKGRAIITASRATEVSIELPELGHGIFTYYLVQGLKGAADLNRDGIVSLQELYEYVEREVAQKSRAVGGNQHPVMKGELEGSLPLVRVKAK